MYNFKSKKNGLENISLKRGQWANGTMWQELVLVVCHEYGWI